MKRSRILLIAAAAVSLVTVALTASAMIVRPDFTFSGYVEIVRRKESCPERDCFAEYFFLSNGTIVRKRFPTPDYETRPEFSVRQAVPRDIGTLIETVRGFIVSHPAAQNWSVDNDKAYLLESGKIATYSAATSDDFSALLRKAQTVFNAAAEAPAADDFFLHSYYQLTGGDIADFHVFGDGTLVFSWFKRRSDEMKSSDLTMLDAKALGELRGLAKSAAEGGVAPVPYRKCDAQSGIDYALVEIRDGGDYVKSYLCPEDASPLMKTFEFLRARQP